jgi:hypothetical protein
MSQTENDLKENLNKINSLFFKHFLNKFDNLNNQLKVADVMLNSYTFRYEKLKQKFSNINDILADNYEGQKEFYQKLEKLEMIDTKLTQVEIKMMNLFSRFERVESALSKK